MVIFGIILGLFRIISGLILGHLGGYFGIILGPFGGHFGGTLWGHLISFWALFGIDLEEHFGSFRCHFERVWDNFVVILGIFDTILGTIK